MHRHVCVLIFIAALFLVSGCGLIFGEEQPPFTAAEIDKYIIDLPQVIKVDIKTRASLGIGPLKEIDRIVKQAKQRKIRELGWDLKRYYYVSKRAIKVVTADNIKSSIVHYEREVRRAPDKAYARRAQRSLKHVQELFKSKQNEIVETIPVSERVFLHERLSKLHKSMKYMTPTFQTSKK